MYCTKCGKEVRVGTKFCTNCGAPVPAAQVYRVKQARPVVTPESDMIYDEDGEGGGPGTKKIVLIALGILLLVLLVAGALVYLYISNRPADTTDAASSAAGATVEGEIGDAASALPGQLDATPTPAPTPAPTPVVTPAPTPMPTFDKLEVQPTMVIAEGERPSCIIGTKRDDLRMRSGPGQDYEVLGRVPKGAQAEVLGSLEGNSEWMLIRYGNVYGWASANYLQIQQ